MENVKLAGKVGAADQEMAEEFLKILAKSYSGKGLCGRTEFQFSAVGTCLFYKDTSKWT